MNLTTGYLLGAAVFAIYALVTYGATRWRVRRGRPRPHDANRERRRNQHGLPVLVLAWAALWPFTLAVHIYYAGDDHNDPQDRVPPQFR